MGLGNKAFLENMLNDFLHPLCNQSSDNRVQENSGLDEQKYKMDRNGMEHLLINRNGIWAFIDKHKNESLNFIKEN